MEGPSGLVLACDGGHWELEGTRRIRRLIGHEVEVTGWRAGFNGLSCDQVWLAGTPRPRRSRIRWDLPIAGALAVIGIAASLWGVVSSFR
nr:DUF5818 domain-containing protein [Novosphingobium piscinae]